MANTNFRGRLLGLALAPLVAILPAGCEVTVDAPPPRDASDVREDTSGTLSSTRITSTSELAGVERVRGHLVIDVVSGAVRLPALTVIEGDLIIVGTAARTLSSDVVLGALVRVGGSVRVAHTSGAGTIAMPRLTEIGGHLELAHGTWSLDLPVLASVGADLRIRTATLLDAAFQALRTIGGSLIIEDLTFAGGVELALGRLESIARDLRVRGGNVYLTASRLLTIGGDLSVERSVGALALAGLRTVGGDLAIGSSILDELAIGAVRSVGDSLIIRDSGGAGFVTLELLSLDTVPGRVVVERVDGLNTLSIGNLTVVGSLQVVGNDSLSKLEFKRLARVDGGLEVSDNGALTIVFDALTFVGGSMLIAGNLGFEGMIPKLTDVGGDFILRDQLTPYMGYAALQLVGGDLRLELLTGTSDFDELRLESLRTVGGAFVARLNTSIEKLTFGNLTSIGKAAPPGQGHLIITDNRALIGVILTRLAEVAGRIEVRNNPKLPTSEIESELEDVVSGSSGTICGNAGGEPCID